MKGVLAAILFSLLLAATGNGVLDKPYWHFWVLMFSAGLWVFFQGLEHIQ